MINPNCKDIIEYLDNKKQTRIKNKTTNFTFILLERKKESWLFNFIESKLSPKYRIKDICRGLIYKKGDFMSLHKDGDYDNAYLSGGMLLNDDYEGGEYIIEGNKLKAPICEVFTFGRNELHEITPIKSGIRYSLHFHVMLREASFI